jgi:hypothetical protein
VTALRAAATRYDKARIKAFDHSETLGICHRFETIDEPLCAIVRLAPPNIGAGIVSHEMAHAAVWIHELEGQSDTSLNSDNDERFCWILGELVRHTVTKLYEHGVYRSRQKHGL